MAGDGLPNYLQYWGVKTRPFSTSVDPTAYFPAATAEEALARMDFVVEQGRTAGVLVGASGVGKTFLLDVFAYQQRAKGAQVVRLNLRGVWPEDFTPLLADAVAVDVADGSGWRLWGAAVDRIREWLFCRVPVVFLIDDLGAARPGVEDYLVRLARVRGGDFARLHFIFAGRGPELVRQCRSLLDLVDLRIELEPWEPDEAAAFVERRLHAAGAPSDRVLFSADAVLRMWELVCGVPRSFVRLADLCLLAGAGEELPKIEAETVDGVFHELFGPAMTCVGADADEPEWDITWEENADFD